MEETRALLEEMLQRENMLNALRRVQQNAGAAGVDGMTVDELGLVMLVEQQSRLAFST